VYPKKVVRPFGGADLPRETSEGERDKERVQEGGKNDARGSEETCLRKKNTPGGMSALSRTKAPHRDKGGETARGG